MGSMKICLTEPMPAGSKTNPTLAKAVADHGTTSGNTLKKGGKTQLNSRNSQREE